MNKLKQVIKKLLEYTTIILKIFYKEPSVPNMITTSIENKGNENEKRIKRRKSKKGDGGVERRKTTQREQKGTSCKKSKTSDCNCSIRGKKKGIKDL